MNTKLIERNTRHLEPTLAGNQLFDHYRNITRELNNAEQTIAALQNEHKGTLRCTASSTFAGAYFSTATRSISSNIS